MQVRPRARRLVGLDQPGSADDPRTRRSALDLGTGSGVQALHLSRSTLDGGRHRRQRRCLALARLTADLNDVTVDLRMGSLFEPVAGETFDLIVTNPPFVISPATDERLVYRDSGLPGDEVVRRVLVARCVAPHRRRLVSGAGQLGAPGGPSVGGAARRLAARRPAATPGSCSASRSTWPGMSRCGSTTRVCGAPTTTSTAMTPGSAGSTSRGSRRRLRLARPAQRRPGRPGAASGGVALRRSSSRSARTWLLGAAGRCRRRRTPVTTPGSRQRLVRAADVVEERIGVPGDADPQHIVLRQQRGMRRARQVTTAEAAFVGACDGELTVGQIADALATCSSRGRSDELRGDRGLLEVRRRRPLTCSRTGFLRGSVSSAVSPASQTGLTGALPFLAALCQRSARRTAERHPEEEVEHNSVADEGTKLVIVESPAKARTISGFLGRGYVVESSIGHIRDLPNNASEVPAKYKGESWGRLGVNVDDGFTPVYVVPADKKKQITKLKSLLKDADELYLATDEDREGEAIAWHLLDELKPTGARAPDGLPRDHARRDRRRRRQPARDQQRPRRGPGGPPHPRPALRLRGLAGAVEEGHERPVGRTRAVGRDPAGRRPRARADGVPRRVVLGPRGDVRRRRGQDAADLPGEADRRRRHAGRPGPRLLLARRAQGRRRRRPPRRGDAPVPWPQALREQTFTVRSVEAKPYRRSPYAPFRTTTLQQEASRKLGYGSARTMQIAQRLYENGYITYMRTDSVTLVGHGDQRGPRPGDRAVRREYLPDTPRTYQSKVKNAQEAHEAIRPAGDSFRTPAQTGLNGDDFRLYELIWMRTVASQMRDAEGRSVSVRIGATATSGEALRVLRERSGHHVPRLPEGVRRGRRRPRGRARRPRDPAARPGRGRRRSPWPNWRSAGHETRPPARLHRGDADPRARGARDRPPVDVRLDHRHDPQPRLRLQEGHGAGAGLAGVLGRAAAGAALRAGSSTTTSPPAWRTSSTRSPPAAATRPASWRSSTSAPTTQEGLKTTGHRARRHRRA